MPSGLVLQWLSHFEIGGGGGGGGGGMNNSTGHVATNLQKARMLRNESRYFSRSYDKSSYYVLI